MDEIDAETVTAALTSGPIAEELAARAENPGKTYTAEELKLLVTENYNESMVTRARALIRVFRGAIREVRFAYQRVVRGWDDSALWSLDYYLTKTLGAQLLKMAGTTPSYPCDWTYECWTSELRRHGQALVAYSAADSLDYDTVYPPAREALQWVTEHLGSLWT
jgi:hypothetical protein